VSKPVATILYKPVGIALSVAAGALAGTVFRNVWRLASGEKDAPSATDERRGWGEILAAATLQGAIFGLVRAAVDRAGASGFRRLTGRWPG